MVETSRLRIYDYLRSLFVGLVNNNVYCITAPTSNTQSDTKDGFIVLNVGDINDMSEFHHDAYGWVRCFVTAYIPKFGSGGYLDDELYGTYEDAITQKIEEEIGHPSNHDYYIEEDSVLSMDDSTESQKGNQYHTFVKSFKVIIDRESN